VLTSIAKLLSTIVNFDNPRRAVAKKRLPGVERLKSLREQRSRSRMRMAGPSIRTLSRLGTIALGLAHGETKARTAAGIAGSFKQMSCGA
jgi:hypothetical protein